MDTVGRFKKGKMTLFLQKGEYQGKPTLSYTLTKSVLKNGGWTKSDFFTITDLQDIQSILQRAVSQYVKYEKVEMKPTPAATEPEIEYEPEDAEPLF